MTKEISLHGGNIYRESEKLGFEPSEIIDFSANINPLGIPENLKAHLHDCLDMCIHYPDPESTVLKGQLAQYMGVSRKNICVGSGALDIIYLIFEVLKLKNILIPAPTFNEYEKAAKKTGMDVVYYQRLEVNGFKLDFNKLLEQAAVNKSEVILICNPNNPTSTLESPEDLINLVNRCSGLGIKVIIDEAFIELTKKSVKNSIAALTSKFDNLYVIRAFTKVFAAPGLRLGYCIASERNIADLEAMQPSWPINTLAAESGIVFEKDSEYINKTNIWINSELDYLYEKLNLIPEISVYPPSTNFILCRLLTEGWDAERLKGILLKEKILIRNAENFVFLNNQFFRLAVKNRENNDRLIEALKNINWR